jgi:hypothetical protein
MPLVFLLAGLRVLSARSARIAAIPAPNSKPLASLQGTAVWPDQLQNPQWKPQIGYLREATAIDGQPLAGPSIRWTGPPRSINWSLADAPPGMKIDDSNRIVWPSPKEGRYLVRVQAQIRGGVEEADWWLNVLKTDFPDPVIFSTRHMDYVVPRAYGDWMRSSGAAGVIDAYYEFGTDLVGGFPSDARQALLYTPSMGGAHSGDPIVSGTDTIGDNDANKWRLGFLFHELGHDLNAWTQVGRIEHGDALADNTLHDMVEFDKIAWVMRMLAAPDKQGVTDPSKFAEWMKAESMEWVPDYERYLGALKDGSDFMHPTVAQSVIWAGMVHEFAFKHGGEALEKVVRAIRNDGIPPMDYPPAKTASERLTLVMCLMSAAAGGNLMHEFVANGFPLNTSIYAQFKPIADKAMANLPAVGKSGMVRCPVDGNYYCVTPYPTNWAQGEATARRMGGHLATIRSPEQERWLALKFANDGWLWVGSTRDSSGNWNWITGEKTPKPIWEPERPESDPAKTCGVLIYHDDAKAPWSGMANRPPNEHRFGIIEVNHVPACDVDSLP